MRAESDETARELVHHHEHPVAPEHDRLAAKQIDAPEAVCRVADERQPGRAASARGWTIVFRQHAVHHVLVDITAECVSDDARDPWAAESRIAGLEFDDRPDESLVRAFRAWLLRARLG